MVDRQVSNVLVYLVSNEASMREYIINKEAESSRYALKIRKFKGSARFFLALAPAPGELGELFRVREL